MVHMFTTCALEGGVAMLRMEVCEVMSRDMAMRDLGRGMKEGREIGILTVGRK